MGTISGEPEMSKLPALLHYDTACRALAEAHRVDEVKKIRDQAVAMQVYAAQAKDTRLITRATEIRMRAERRAGEFLIQMAARKERHTGKAAKGSRVATPTDAPTLSDLGINKTQSSRWQQLAALDDRHFEHKVKNASALAYDNMTRRIIKADKIERAKQRHGKLIEHGCTVDDLVTLAESSKRFQVVYADPPWPFETSASRKILSAVDNHYGTSPLDVIAKLPVARLAADNCALLLWCTGPHITIGTHVEIIRAWGFKPSTIAFVWVKQKQSGDGLRTNGQGYWTTANAEICFIATKGSPLRLNADVHQVIEAPVAAHSEKPEEVRRRIERLFPGPYLELYGRKLVPGWTVWGDEVPPPIAEAAE
jgi:N6-adenosine-specific RNA methylase IME4